MDYHFHGLLNEDRQKIFSKSKKTKTAVLQDSINRLWYRIGGLGEIGIVTKTPSHKRPQHLGEIFFKQTNVRLKNINI